MLGMKASSKSKDGKKKSGPMNVDSARESGKGSSDRLRTQQQKVRKDKRGLMAKRQRGIGQDSEQTQKKMLAAEELHKLANVAKTIDVSSPEFPATLADVRKVLCYNDPPIQMILEAGFLEKIIVSLHSASDATKSDAIWCLTNIATGTQQQTKQVLHAVPILLQIISGNCVLLSEQACWTIGNVAGDSDEFRTTLIANGSIHALGDFLQKSITAAAADPTNTDLHNTRASTASWALSNLARGSSTARSFIDVGIVPFLLSLTNYIDRTVAKEVWWIFTFLSAKEEESVTVLLQQGLIQALDTSFKGLKPEDVVNIPIVRTLGNLTSGPVEWINGIVGSGDLILSLKVLTADTSTTNHALLKECMWSINNILGGSPECRTALLKVGILDNIIPVIYSDQFELQKESIFALRHASQDHQALIHLLQSEGKKLFQYLIDFIRVADNDMAIAAIQILRALAFATNDSKSSVTDEYLNMGMLDELESLEYTDASDSLIRIAKTAADDLFEPSDDEVIDEPVAAFDFTPAQQPAGPRNVSNKPSWMMDS